jgi:molybdopterin-guanine dinucleotide biosynthesis protein A
MRIARCLRRRETGLPEATGVVLAGGRSTRFGRDKLAESYKGMPLFHHAILRLGEVCSEVVVVLPPGAVERSPPIGVEVRFARDPVEGEGPLAGMHAGLLAARHDVALVAAGDMPELQTRVMIEMLRVADEAQSDAVGLRDGDAVRPLPCVVRTTRGIDVSHALLHDGRRALRDLLDALRTAVVDEPTWVTLDPERRTLFDVDEPSDLIE